MTGRRLDLPERLLHPGFRPVSLEVDEEEVVPRLAPRRPRLDQREIDPRFLKGREQIAQRPHVVFDRHHEGGLVVAAGLGVLHRQDEKAGHVIVPVLDRGGENPEIVDFGRFARRDGGRVLLLRGDLGRSRTARHLPERHREVVEREPLAALRQNLGLGTDLANLVRLAAPHQVVTDGYQDLRADPNIEIREQIERAQNAALRRVLHGDHAIIRLSLRDGGKNVLERAHGDTFHAVPEPGSRCQV